MNDNGKTSHESGYTYGELHALIAPVLGRDPDDLEMIAIVGIGKDGSIITGGTTGCADCTARVIGLAYMLITNPQDGSDDVEALFRAVFGDQH